jgi:hypothetical protein
MTEIPEFNERTVQKVQGGLARDEVATCVAVILGPYHLGLDAEELRALLEPHHACAWARRGREVDRARMEAKANGVQVVVDATLPHTFVREELPDEVLPGVPTRQHPDGPLSTYQRLHGQNVISKRP